MKTPMKKTIFFFIAMLSIVGGASAQYVVKVRPVQPTVAIAQPHRPGPSHIWVDGSWIWRSGGYVWVDGYWLAPRPGYYWRNGYWKHHHDGYVWVAGSWRRR